MLERTEDEKKGFWLMLIDMCASKAVLSDRAIVTIREALVSFG